MSFTQKTFAPVASNSTNTPGFWSYQTKDNFEDVLIPGYFDQKKNQLSIEDFIWVIASDARRVIRYNGEEDPPEIISPKPPVLVLEAASNSMQTPTGTDTPLQIEFGPAQGTVDDPVMLSAQGLGTVNETGFYDAQIFVNITRTMSSGMKAELKLAIFKNGIQFGDTLTAFVDNPNTNHPLQIEVFGNFIEGDTFYAEIARDSNGANDGSLEPLTNNQGWNITPSARTKVFKLV